MTKKSNFLSFIAFLILTGCSTTSQASEQTGLPETHFFLGQVKRSSIDEKQIYGSPFSSLVKRTVSANRDIVQECVFQENKVFVTTMSKTTEPLKYEVKDSGQFSKGFLIYSDNTLNSWSYDIDVLKPTSGKISGSLQDKKGGQIFSDGRMEIKKVWNQQVLIQEHYDSISSESYLAQLKELKQTLIPEPCQ